MDLSSKWEEIITSWESSGLNQRRFCEEHEVSHNQLSYWKRKLRPGSSRTPRFKRMANVGVSSCFEVISANGTIVRVPAGFHTDSLKRLLDVLK